MGSKVKKLSEPFVQPTSWLLRLFQSDFFDSRMALQYLHKHPDSVGMQHYICKDLKKYSSEQVDTILPQLLHYVLHNPDAIAVEELILFRCKNSPHTALLVMWFLQAYVSDYQNTPNSLAFRVAQRVSHKVQRVVFSDTPQTIEGPKKQGERSKWLPGPKIKENIPPAIVGVGTVLAGAASSIVGSVAWDMIVMQGRKQRSPQLPFDPEEEEVSIEEEAKKVEGKSNGGGMKESRSTGSITTRDLIARVPSGSPSVEDLSRGSAFSLNRYAAKATSVSQTLFPFYNGDRSSSESIGSQSIRASSLSLDSELASEVSVEDCKRIAKSHYFHAEIQFIRALVEIGDRLRSVPRESRQSNLIAALVLLNHNLPAEICLPLWCNAAENHKHHRILRIAPDEAVILNSADRVPYLICIEVEEDPEEGSVPLPKYANSKNGIAGKNWTENTPVKAEVPVESVKENQTVSFTDNADADSAELNVTKVNGEEAEPSTACGVGSNDSSTEDLKSDSPSHVATPPCASLASSPPAMFESNPELTKSGTASEIQAYPGRTTPLFSGTDSGAQSPNAVRSRRNTVNASVTAQIDEFSERMRTAAVMLAQLYQQQQKELMALSAFPPGSVAISSSGTVSPGATALLGSRISMGGDLDVRRSTSPPPGSPDASGSNLSGFNGPSSPVNRGERRKYQKLKAEFEEIRNRLLREIVSLEEKRLKLVTTAQTQDRKSIGGISAAAAAAAGAVSVTEPNGTANKEDPSAAVFKESWETKQSRIRESSPFGLIPTWRLHSVIVKSGADLRQEQLALQLIGEMNRIWKEAGVPVWVHHFKILVTSEQAGLVETIRNTISIHSIKKMGQTKAMTDAGQSFTLYHHFLREFGHPSGAEFMAAQDNFMRSLAAYSILSYVLQIKDRHDGNILVDSSGHLVHIDFGFMLSNSPGSMGFELAPFKLTQEYVDILGGTDSVKFREFRELLKEAFLALRKKVDTIVTMLEMMEKDSTLPCFTGASSKPSTVYIPPNASSILGSGTSSNQSNLDTLAIANSYSAAVMAGGATGALAQHWIVASTASATSTSSGSTASQILASASAGSGAKHPVSAALRERFQLSLTDQQVNDLVDRLVYSSSNNMFTKLYDSFQYYANGIL
ncbi:kinase-like domain-containing protein [Cladochytrium replicatum]|nr:kinase-like domain-containing protein [Cladochytrium replicatum]